MRLPRPLSTTPWKKVANGRSRPIALTAGDTSYTDEEFREVVNLARHVVAISRGPNRRKVTVRDVTFATFILALVG